MLWYNLLKNNVCLFIRGTVPDSALSVTRIIGKQWWRLCLLLASQRRKCRSVAIYCVTDWTLPHTLLFLHLFLHLLWTWKLCYERNIVESAQYLLSKIIFCEMLWNDTCHYDKHARSNCAWINADSSEANFVDWAILIIVQNSPSCCAPASLWFFDEILANILITIILLLFSVCSPKSQNSRCFLQKVLTVSPVSDLRVYWISSPASSIWETLSLAKARKEKLISPQSLR